MRDCNTREQNEAPLEFLKDNELSNLVKFLTCFENGNNPNNIDLITTNRPKSFQSSVGIPRGLSDFL